MNHYVYIYLDTRKPGEYIYDDLKFDYEPFYVGQGKNNRCKNGLKEGSAYKLRKINKILNGGLQPQIIKLYEYLDYDTAIKLEIDVISKIGRNNLKKGPLVNLTDGGEGRKNVIVSEETRKKQSLVRIGKSPSNKGVPRSEETKHKISESLKGEKHIYYGKHFSIEHKKRLSESNKKKQIKPVYQYSLSGDFLKEYESILEASIDNKINPSIIGKCCRKIGLTAGGFKWEFKIKTDNHRKIKKIL